VQENGRAYVKIEFDNNLRSTNDIDFSMKINLTVNKSTHENSALDLRGTYKRDTVEVSDDDYGYYDISNGEVLEATSYVRNVEVYIGEGVTIHTNLVSGRKYSGSAYYDFRYGDEDVFDEFPSIEQMLYLNVTNLDRNSKVSFDMPGSGYYVYNAEGEYVGRSNNKVPFSSKYYFSTKSIDLEYYLGGGDAEPDDDYNEPPVPLGDYPTQNSNDNPATGR
jgi:hypothetical protein